MPRGSTDIFLLGVADFFAIDNQRVIFYWDFGMPLSMHRVKAKQVGGRVNIASALIDMDNLKVWGTPVLTKGKPANTAETIDSNSYSHLSIP